MNGRAASSPLPSWRAFGIDLIYPVNLIKKTVFESTVLKNYIHPKEIKYLKVSPFCPFNLSK